MSEVVQPPDIIMRPLSHRQEAQKAAGISQVTWHVMAKVGTDLMSKMCPQFTPMPFVSEHFFKKHLFSYIHKNNDYCRKLRRQKEENKNHSEIIVNFFCLFVFWI